MRKANKANRDLSEEITITTPNESPSVTRRTNDRTAIEAAMGVDNDKTRSPKRIKDPKRKIYASEHNSL